MKNLIQQLENRGFIAASTSQDINEIASKPLTVYVGFDPTSDSLHLGNLVGIMGLAWFQRYGHTPIALVGGATGMIGDPSGKSMERILLNAEMVAENVKGIEKSLRQILRFDNGNNPVRLLNNLDWFNKFSLIDFLRDIGKNFRLSTMLAKDSVKSRVASEEGMSYTEFSYQLLQAFDFLHLYDVHKVVLQMGGSDQWGNITAGCELVRKMRGETVYGLTFPLLTRSDGKKFGKSEEGAIWLNADKLSEYDFYQYLYRVSDSDVITLMKMLTFMELEEISNIEMEMKSAQYRANSAQMRLASEVTRIVHGEKGLKLAQEVTRAARPGEKTALASDVLEVMAKEIPCQKMALEAVLGKETAELFVTADLCESKGEARRLISGKGAYLNNERIEDPYHRINEVDLIEKRFLLLAVGKKKKRVIEIS